MNTTFTLRQPLLLWVLFCIFLLSQKLSILACGQDDLPPSPVYFIENNGQWHENIRYQAQMNAARLYLEDNSLTYLLIDGSALDQLHDCQHGITPENGSIDMRMHALRINFIGANTQPNLDPLCMQSHYRNYYIGNNPSKWASNVREYEQIDYNELYNGIDLNFYGYNRGFKYDFIVHPDADANNIKWQYEGAESVYIEDDKLHVITSVNNIIELAPYAFQLINGERLEIACQYILNDDNELSFNFPDGYNTQYDLIIDPEIIFASYTGSTADNWGFTATYDGDGALYAGGAAFGIGYPTTTGALLVEYQGGGSGLGTDIGISKFSPDGSTLEFSTYLGGTDNEFPSSLIVDNNEHLYVLGVSSSADYPTTANALSPNFSGGQSVTINSIGFQNGSDIVVSKLQPDGTALVGSTFLGGSNNDGLNTALGLKYNYADEGRGEIDLDDDGNVYIASCTQSFDFPVTIDSYQPMGNGGQEALALKLSSDLSEIIWGTLVSGSADDAAYSVELAEDGSVFFGGGTTSSDLPITFNGFYPFPLGGVDGWVAHLSADGSEMLSGTYVGTDGYNQVYLVALDQSGDVYISGQTDAGFMVTEGTYHNLNSGQFIQKFSPNLLNIQFSTTFGSGNGAPAISPTAFLVDNCNQIYVSGWGGSVNTAPFSTTNGLPVTADAVQSTTDGSDYYFIVLSPDAEELVYATFYGAEGGGGEHVDGGTSRFDPAGIAYQAVCAGCGGTSLFPTTPGAWSETNNASNCNLGVIKFDFQLAPTIADFEIPDLGCAPQTITFENNSTNAENYYWDLGNGQTSTNVNPTANYTASGEYTVTLIAEKLGTCNGSDTTNISFNLADPQDISLQVPFFCENGTPQAIVPSQTGGTFEGDYIDPTTGMFDPTGLSPGSYTISYNNNLPECPLTVSTQVDIYPQAQVNVINTYCANDGTNNFWVEYALLNDGSSNITQYATSFSNLDSLYNFTTDTLTNYVTLQANNTDTLYNADIQLYFNNGNSCQSSFAISIPNCPDCVADAGTMDTALITACSEQVINASTTNTVLFDGQSLFYALHTSPSDTLGNIIALNTTGTFAFDDLPDSLAHYYQTYYISPIVAFTNADGQALLNDDCTDIAAGLPVLWFSPIVVELDEKCNYVTGQYNVWVALSGGLPGYDNSQTYTVSGDYNGTVGINEVIHTTYAENTTNTYLFEATDSTCESLTIAPDEPFECIKTPIELLSFTAQHSTNGHLINWLSASEQNNAYYTLWHSTDGTNWQKISTINGAGNSDMSQNYAYTHRPQAPCIVHYYRLSWTDFNGNTQFAPTIHLRPQSQTGQTHAAQINSVNNQVSIHVNATTNGTTQLHLYDTAGKAVLTQIVQHNTCQQIQFNFSTAQLAAGLYFIALQTNPTQPAQVYKWIKY